MTHLFPDRSLVNMVKTGHGSRIWIDLNQADKKVLAILVAGVLWTPLWALSPLYLTYLCVWVRKKGKRLGLPVSPVESLLVASLLVVKSTAMAAGRLVGSWRYRVLCF